MGIMERGVASGVLDWRVPFHYTRAAGAGPTPLHQSQPAEGLRRTGWTEEEPLTKSRRNWRPCLGTPR